MTQPKGNPQVDPDHKYKRTLSDIAIPAEGPVVHIKGYGLINVLRLVVADGDTEHWTSNDLTMDASAREELATQVWTIEPYHRRLKQFCGARTGPSGGTAEPP